MQAVRPVLRRLTAVGSATALTAGALTGMMAVQVATAPAANAATNYTYCGPNENYGYVYYSNGISGAQSCIRIFTSAGSGTYAFPAGATSLKAWGVAGGGGGGAQDNGGPCGQAGTSGQAYEWTSGLSTGTSYTYVVGAGGGRGNPLVTQKNGLRGGNSQAHSGSAAVGGPGGAANQGSGCTAVARTSPVAWTSYGTGGNGARGHAGANWSGDDGQTGAVIYHFQPAAVLAPSNVSVSTASTTGTANVTWTAPADTTWLAKYTVTATSSNGGTSRSCTSVKSGYSVPSAACQVASLTPGKTYTFSVKSANAMDTESAAATSSAYVVPDPPTNTVVPAVSGTGGVFAVGTSVSSAAGTWTGTAPITYAYQWQSCTNHADLSTCGDISGATTSSYTPGAAQAGTYLRAKVTATNVYASVTAYSVPASAEQVTTTPAFTAQSPTFGVVGTAYSYSFAASGYQITYALASGSLPAGLTLNSGTGVLSGTPSTRGSSTFTISATNSSGSVTSSSISLAVQENQTVTINDPASQTYSPGGTFAVSGSATSGLPVTFGSSTSSVCTVSGTTVSILTGGTCTITGNQAGDSDWLVAPQATRNVTINKASQTVSFTYTGGPKTYGNAPFSVASMASATSGLTPTFTSSTAPVCTVTPGGDVTLVAQGTCTLVADQPGDSSYLAATSTVSQSFTVNRGTTTISWSPTTALTMPQSPVTFAAASSLAGAITYAVTNAGLTGCTVDSSTRVLTFTAVGSCTVSATAARNDQYESVATSATFVITKADQTISITDPGAKTYSVGGTFTISATATSSLTVSFGSSTTSICTVSGTTVTIVGAGTCRITADQAGDGSYNAAPQATQDVVISPAATTVTWSPTTAVLTTASPMTPSALASVSTGGGAITYSVASAGTTACTVDPDSGVLTYTTSGSCTVTATSAATANYASGATSVTFVISKVAQTITFGSLSSPRAYSADPFAISATTTAPGLLLTFTASPASVCSVTSGTSLVGGATTGSVRMLAVGTCTIVASQAGSDRYSAATDVPQTLTISQGTQAALSFANSMSSTFGQTLTLSTIGGTGSGGVTYNLVAAGTANCSVNSSTGVVTFGSAGQCTVSATKAGGGVYADVTTSTATITVARAPQTTTITSSVPANPLPGGTYAVTATASSGLTATLSLLGSIGVCSITSTGAGTATVTFIASGTCTVMASNLGDGNYLAPEVEDTQVIEVGALNQSITFAALSDKDFGSAPFSVSATASSGLGVTFSTATSAVCTVSSAGRVVIVTVGVCKVTAAQNGNAQYAAASPVARVFTISAVAPYAPTISSASAGDGTITIGYGAPGFTGGVPIVGYQATASGTGGPVVVPCSDLTAPLVCTISGLTNGTAYTVTVAAINSLGVGAASGATGSLTPAAAAMAVTGAYAVPGDGSVDLHFDAVSNGALGGGAFTEYQIFRRVAGNAWPGTPTSTSGTQGAGVLSQSYSGLANGTSYEFKIVVITTANAVEITGNTTIVTEYPSTLPTAPIDLEAFTATGTSALISWAEPLSNGGAEITDYAVALSGGRSCGPVTIDPITRVGSCTASGLAYSTRYTITVAATNRMGEGADATTTYRTGADPNTGGAGGGIGGGGTVGGGAGGGGDAGPSGPNRPVLPSSGPGDGPRPPFPPNLPTPDGPTKEQGDEAAKKPSTGSVSDLPTMPILRGTGPMPGGEGRIPPGLRGAVKGAQAWQTSSPEMAAALAAGRKVVVVAGTADENYMTSRKITVVPETMLQVTMQIEPGNDIEFRLWMQDREGTWFRMGTTTAVKGQLVFPVIEFTEPGTYQVVATSVMGEGAANKDGSPVWGSTTVRTIVIVTPRQEMGAKICPNTVAFDSRSAVLSRQAKRDLRKLAECLGAMPHISVTGYVAQAVRPEAAKRMAYLRARNVRNYLRELGYDGVVVVQRTVVQRPSECDEAKNRCSIVRLDLGEARAAEKSAWELAVELNAPPTVESEVISTSVLVMNDDVGSGSAGSSTDM